MNSTTHASSTNPINTYDAQWKEITNWIQPWRFNQAYEQDKLIGVIKLYNLIRLSDDIDINKKKNSK